METSSGRSLDMISQLPVALLVKILSSLPTTKEVVASSVLSKQWRSLWKMVPNLKFNLDPGNDSDGFADSVGRTLLSLEVPYLQSLHLDVSLGRGANIYDFEEVFGIASGLHVRELELTISDSISGNAGYMINSPSLKKLKISAVEDTIRSELTTINAPELAEATIYANDEYLLAESLTSVKRLSLSIKDIQVPAGSIFNQLEYLQLTTCYPLSWNPLAVMLDNSPNLQVLEIIGFQEPGFELTWKQPECVPQGLVHLKTVDWYIEGLTYGEEVAKYILSNARCLENVVLRMAKDFPEEERVKVCHDMEGWCPDDCKFELIVAPIGTNQDEPSEPETVTVAPFVGVTESDKPAISGSGSW